MNKAKSINGQRAVWEWNKAIQLESIVFCGMNVKNETKTIDGLNCLCGMEGLRAQAGME